MEFVRNIGAVFILIGIVELIMLLIKRRKSFFIAIFLIILINLVCGIIATKLDVDMNIAISIALFISVVCMAKLYSNASEFKREELEERERKRKEAEEEAQFERELAELREERARLEEEREEKRKENEEYLERVKEIITEIDDEKELDELKNSGKKIKLVIKNIEESGEDFLDTECEFLSRAEEYGANLVLIKEKALNKTQVDTGEREEIEAITKTGQPRKVKRAVMKDVEFYKIVGDFYKMAD